MSTQQRVHGVKILKAVSSPLRLQLLNYLFDKGELSYTELMNSLKLSPNRDAGRFAYHLKFLLKADLIEADVETRKYCLTDLGKMVIDVADHIARRSLKPRELLVRTSKFTLEEFDSNKITNSLIKEAKVPAELAQKVAKEAEKNLLKSKTKYITAPLVREVVNAILVEKGLEEYRHKLTRLGLPVQEVTALIETQTDKPHQASEVQETAGKSVLDEYVLLNVFPRDIADAHLSGALHISGLNSWILEPDEIMHDLRFFLHNGITPEEISTKLPFHPPPNNLQSALFTIQTAFAYSAKETRYIQTFDYFNVFLAPFMKGLQPSEAKELLHHFIASTSQIANLTLGLELTVPDFLTNKPATQTDPKHAGVHGDFIEETQLLASLIIEVLAEQTTAKPFFNPEIIVKIRPETFENRRAKAILLKTHSLSSNRSLPIYANLLRKHNAQSTFSGSGLTLRPDRTHDWEIDTLRTGSLGTVAVNLPRIVYECEGDKTKLLLLLKERLELATRAIEIKYQALKRHGKNQLPFLMQNGNGERYFRLENCSATVNLTGFKEATEAFTGKSFNDPKTLEFAKELSEEASAFTAKTGKRRNRKISTSILPDTEASKRLAQLDIERYGVAKVKFSGTRDKPYYSTTTKLTFKDEKASPNSLVEAQESGRLNIDELDLINLGGFEYDPNELLALTEKLVRQDATGLFTYDRNFTYCMNCKKTWFSTLQKCPSCGAVSSLTLISRYRSV